MRKTTMAAALAGVMGMVGLAAPQVARAQAQDPGDRPACPCQQGGPGGPGMGPGGHGGPGMMGPGGRHGMMGPGHGPGMMDGGLQLGPIWRLDLTDSQRTQLEKLTGDFRHDNWATIGKLMDARSNLRQAETAAQPDPRKVGAAFAEVSKLEQVLLEARVQAGNQARALLTPAQRQQLEQWQKEGPGPDAARGGQGRTGRMHHR